LRFNLPIAGVVVDHPDAGDLYTGMFHSRVSLFAWLDPPREWRGAFVHPGNRLQFTMVSARQEIEEERCRS
jgi:hypothetical protein